jgi:hypothetical protein
MPRTRTSRQHAISSLSVVRGRRAVLVGGWACAALVVVSCSGSDGSDAPAPTGSPFVTVPATGPGDTAAGTTVPEPTDDTSETSAPTAAVTASTQPPTTPVPPPPTGVPGIDSDDAFCRDYARILGTSTLLGISSAFLAQPTDEIVRLEVIAAPAVLAAADSLPGEVPEAAAADTDTLLADVVDPLTQRSIVIDAALVAAGVDSAGRAALIEAWDAVLASDDPVDPAIEVPDLDSALAAQVDVAIASLTLPPYLEDPAVAAAPAQTPLVQAYVQSACPEILGLLGDQI